MRFKKTINKKNRYLMASVAIILIFLIVVIVLISQNRRYVNEVNDYEILVSYKPFGNLNTVAKSVHVFDSKEDAVIYSKESNDPLPIASITKFMTILTAAEALPPSFPVVIEPGSLQVDGYSGLMPFERWEFQELAAYTLIVSSNDGADAIARAASDYFQKTEGLAFVEKMNKKARHIGMENSTFYNPTGLDETPSKAGAYSTAEDVSRMVDYMTRIHPNLVEDTQRTSGIFNSLSGFAHQAENTNQEIDHIEGLMASKTGFTDLAGGNLVVAAEISNGRIIIITVLGSTREARFSDVLSLHQETLRYYKFQEKMRELEEDVARIFKEI